jgi:hypothetical protein
MNFRSLVAVLGVMLALAACGGGGSEAAAPPGNGGGTSNPSGSTGTLQVSLTDAPACGYEAVYVTVVGVRVHQSDAAGDDDGGWVDLPLATPYTTTGLRITLLDLTNGVLQGLGQVVLPAGRYTQMRLLLAENVGNAAPFANSVVPTGGAETALTTPSAQQSGLKIKINAEVPAGKVAHLVIDFDACKSVVKRGKSGKYNLKPVLSATLLLSDATGMRVLGCVSPLLRNGHTQVSLQSSSVPVKATVPDPTTGKFVLFPVPVGSYDLVIAAPGHATAVMTGVPVVASVDTAVGAPDQCFVDGTVVPDTAQMRALQTLSGGPTIEVAWSAVDGDTDVFGFSLPEEAPVRASYLSVNPLIFPPVPLAFVPDTNVKGRYTVEAASGGSVKTQSIDVLAPVPDLSFIFP